MNAGILPYTYDDHGTAFFLIGKEPSGHWADFGGRGEDADITPLQTAAREFSEETRYVFGKWSLHKNITQEKKRKRLLIKKDKKNRSESASICYIAPRVTKELVHPQGYYTMYLARVDFIPAHIFGKAAKVPHYEKRAYQWVPVHAFMEAMEKATDRYHAYYGCMQMRRQFYDTLSAHKEVIMQTIHPQAATSEAEAPESPLPVSQ